jgi:hypothetical protein
MSKFLAAATALFIPLSGQAIVAPVAADTITMTITGTVAPYQFNSGLLGLVMLWARHKKYILAATVLLIPLSAQAQTRPHAKDRHRQHHRGL